MVMTARWLSLAEASARLGIPEFEVLEMAVSGRLHSRLTHDHREVCAADVEEFASELATPSGDVLAEHANRVSIRGGPDIGDQAEAEYDEERRT